jgi:hypothetical protein
MGRLGTSPRTATYQGRPTPLYSSTYGKSIERPTNYTTVDEITTGEEVLVDTFFLNEH